jgi:sarcosine oxidase / L-pipecolate oxidase
MCCGGGDAAWQHCVKYAEGEDAELVPLNTKEQFHATMPEGVLTGPFPGWRGYWKRTGAGWVFAVGALRAMHTEAVRLGVQFVTGYEKGRAERLLYSTAGDKIIGVQTADNVQHASDHTILAAGANIEALLDFKKQLRPTAWTLAHIPLSAEEAQLYRDLPVLYGIDRGFFIEPDLEKHEIKASLPTTDVGLILSTTPANKRTVGR